MRIHLPSLEAFLGLQCSLLGDTRYCLLDSERKQLLGRNPREPLSSRYIPWLMVCRDGELCVVKLQGDIYRRKSKMFMRN